MELGDLSESQQELLHPVLELKTEISLDCMVLIRDIFSDLYEVYNTFAISMRKIGQKASSCHKIASSGIVSPQASEALLLVRGSVPNVSDLVQSATAEQSGALEVWKNMTHLLNRLSEDSAALSSTISNSIVNPLSSFTSDYAKSLRKNVSGLHPDSAVLISTLLDFKKSPGYTAPGVKKRVDGVLKAYNELESCINLENELAVDIHRDPSGKLLAKAKNRTIKAKLSLEKHTRQLFSVAPELRGIANVESLSQAISLSQTKGSSQANPPSESDLKGHEYQSRFCDLERRRLKLLSGCLQIWVENHVNYEKGLYSGLESLWNAILHFSPESDYRRFENILIGNRVETEETHSRIVSDEDIWIPSFPGPIEILTKTTREVIALPTIDAPTPMERSDDDEESSFGDAYTGDSEPEKGSVVGSVEEYNIEYSISSPGFSHSPPSATASVSDYSNENGSGIFGLPPCKCSFDMLQAGRERSDAYMMDLYNLCRIERPRDVPLEKKFDWVHGRCDDVVDVLEHHCEYPFLIRHLEYSRTHPLKFEYSFDGDMKDEQWSIVGLEVLILLHCYLCGFLSHPALNIEDKTCDIQLREFLLSNLGVMEQVIAMVRTLAELYRDEIGISTRANEILDLVLKPRDSFVNGSPLVNVHVMDIRYRILLLIDSWTKGDLTVNNGNGQLLFSTPEFYDWIHRQLDLVHISLIQKLARILRISPRISKKSQGNWLEGVRCENPWEKIGVNFSFPDMPNVERCCNKILWLILHCIGTVVYLKKLAARRVWGPQSDETEKSNKELIAQLFDDMVYMEELDEYLQRQQTKDRSTCGSDDSTGFIAKPELGKSDYCTDMGIYMDEEISVLAEIRQSGTFCMGSCRKTMNRLSDKAEHKGSGRFGLSKCPRNVYLWKGVDPLNLSHYWRMEDPLILRIIECYHKCLCSGDLQFSNIPSHLQMISFVAYFMQTGLLLNFQLLKPSNIKEFRIPLLSHSLLALDAYWHQKFTDVGDEGNMVLIHEEEEKSEPRGPNEPYQRLKLRDLGFVPGLKTRLKCSVKVDEPSAKQLLVLLQLPGNVQRLPIGLGNLDCYMLFDTEKLVEESLSQQKESGAIDILPNFMSLEYCCIDSVLLDTPEKLELAKMQIRSMQISRARNKVHKLLADIIDNHIPNDFCLKHLFLRERNLTSSGKPSPVSLLLPSVIECGVSSILYLRLSTARFRAQIFEVLCNQRLDVHVLEYLISVFVLLHRLLFMDINSKPPISGACLDQSGILESIIADNERGSGAVTLRGLLLHIVACRARNLVLSCVEEAKRSLESQIKETIRQTDPKLACEMLIQALQMLREELSASAMWDSFLPFAEFPVLFSRCFFEFLRPYVMDAMLTDTSAAKLIMPHLQNFLVLQREIEVSMIVRHPNTDQNIQSELLLSVMFFKYSSLEGLSGDWTDYAGGMLKQHIVNSLDEIFASMSDMVLRSVENEEWNPIGGHSLHSSAVVDLVVVLQHSLRASFDLGVPVEWLIFPFTNACERILKLYCECVARLYDRKRLGNIHALITGGDAEFDNFVAQLCQEVIEGEQNDIGDFLTTRRSIVVSSTRQNIAGDSIPQSDVDTNEDAGQFSAVLQDSCVHADIKRTETDRIKRRLKKGWKTVSLSMGTGRGHTHSEDDISALLDEFAQSIRGKSVLEDLVRIWNVDFISSKLSSMPEEILGYYYKQLRQRDAEYESVHASIGTSNISNCHNFFFIEPQQLVLIPHAKPHISLIWAAQRLMQREAELRSKEIIVLLAWKLVLFEFRRDFFVKLYYPTVQDGYKLSQLIVKFSKTIVPFLQQIPHKYRPNALDAFMNAIFKVVTFILRQMRRKGHKFAPQDSKLVAADVEALQEAMLPTALQTLDTKHSLESLRNLVKKL